MAYTIKDYCINCGGCSDCCPMGAIYGEDSRYTIDVGRCVDCGECESVCPVSAIQFEG